MKTIEVCLHLAAFGCEQCKAIVRQEIEKERERCAKIAEPVDEVLAEVIRKPSKSRQEER